MLARIFAIALVALLLAPAALAAPPAGPQDLPNGMRRYAYAELSFAQPNLTALTLTGEIWLYRHDVGGDVYDADDMGDAYAGSNKYAGRPTGDAFANVLEQTTRAALAAMLTASFGDDSTVSGLSATVDRATLRPASGNPHDAPVRVAVAADVLRSKASIGLGTLSDAAIAAAFSAGAKVSTPFFLAAGEGYRIVYSVGAPASPAGLRYVAGEGVSADGLLLTLEVDNTGGDAATRTLTATLSNPAVSPPVSEDIRSVVDVAMGTISPDAAGIPIAIDVDAEIGALAATRFPGALPEGVLLPYVAAGGLRMLRASGALTDADVARANEALLNSVRADIQRVFGNASAVTGGLDSADLLTPAASGTATAPPVGFRASTQTVYAVAGADGADIDLALRIGGAAAIDLRLFAANGGQTTFTLHPPAIAEFTLAQGGTLSENGQVATFVVPAGAATLPAAIEVRGRDIPVYDAQNATVSVTVDLQDLDVSVGEAAGGDFGDLLIDLTIEGDLHVIEVPDALRGSLPEDLELDFLSSDAIRLLVDRGRIDEADLAELEARMLDDVESKLGAALGGDVPSQGGLDRATLDVSLVSSPIRGDEPVVFKATARVVKPLSGGPVQPAAAIALYSQALPLSLPKIQDFDTVYTVILPRGLAVTDVTGTGGQFETGTAPDGREQFTVRPTSDEAEITATMAVTPTFVLLKFWPLVLLAVILLVLIVGTPIAIVRLKKRKR